MIEGLRQLDAVDRVFRDLERERAGLPAEKARLEGAVNALREELRAIEAELRESARARKTAEGEIERNAEAIRRYDAQKNFVHTPREADALAAQIDALRAKNAALSETAYAEMDRSEGLEARRSTVRKDMAEGEETRKKREVEIEERSRELDAAIERAREERSAAAALLPPAVFGRYEKIRAGKDGIAIARVEREACEVCYRSIPPQRIIEIKKLEKLVTCEGCGRILLCG